MTEKNRIMVVTNQSQSPSLENRASNGVYSSLPAEVVELVDTHV